MKKWKGDSVINFQGTARCLSELIWPELPQEMKGQVVRKVAIWLKAASAFRFRLGFRFSIPVYFVVSLFPTCAEMRSQIGLIDWWQCRASSCGMNCPYLNKESLKNYGNFSNELCWSLASVFKIRCGEFCQEATRRKINKLLNSLFPTLGSFAKLLQRNKLTRNKLKLRRTIIGELSVRSI